MNTRITMLAAVAACLILVPSAFAADPLPPVAPDPLSVARQHIAEKSWPAAIDELKRVGATSSADWNNLMGYSLRRSSPPDYPAAARYYDEALRIDPRHKGALEYSGELYLILGRLEDAEERLAALDKACFFPCEEYTDLKRAVARYKAAGHKYVAAP